MPRRRILDVELSGFIGVNARNRFAVLFIVVVACALAGCSESIFNAQGPIGAANTQILFNALGIMLVIVVPTIVGVLLFAWWFRASNTRARYQPGFVYSGRMPLTMTQRTTASTATITIPPAASGIG